MKPLQKHVIAAALTIFEPVCRIIEETDVNTTDFLCMFIELSKIVWLFKEILRQGNNSNRIDYIREQAGIPADIFEKAFRIGTVDIFNPPYIPLIEASINGFTRDADQTVLLPPIITLAGRIDPKEVIPLIHFDFQHESGDNLSTRLRVFSESIRQQLTHKCGFVCPFAYKGKICCGSQERLSRLYNRIPKEYKYFYKKPNCDLVR
jgi:hypothetical protein